MTALVWLRGDLRLDDQPAIRAAAGEPALYLYVHDETVGRPLGGASRWWLGRSLVAFGEALSRMGARLDVVRGAAGEVLPALAGFAQRVYWTRRYDGAGIETDRRVKAEFRRLGASVESFNGQLLREPWEVATEAGGAFKVFTPFWRRSREMGPFAPPERAPARLVAAPWPAGAPRRVEIAELGLHPEKPDWSGGLADAWRPGEQGAKARLKHFLGQRLSAYAEARDLLDDETGSRLSPHLRFGEISPRRVVAAIEAAAQDAGGERGAEKFLAELGWREFSHSLLYQEPALATKNWNARFDGFPWRDDAAALRAWRRGLTGYPVVDAAMRELWRTGYMPNRARMIAGSFLTKHLGIDWRAGEAWFWDTLCDADGANNPANWQWVAGSGADAAPYFRVFNPVLQAEKFDARGAYVRRWVPELAKLDARHIHAPWRASAHALAQAGVALGETYPRPIVDHGQARARALAAFARVSQRSPTRRNSANSTG